MTLNTDQDIVDVLTAQHEQITALLAHLQTTSEDKRELFEELVRLLAMHESAEQEVVHPVADRIIGTGKQVKTRLAEENHAKDLLAELHDLGPDHPDFGARLADLVVALTAHIAHEEAEEFVLLRQRLSAEELQSMAAQARFAESLAPTRSHPGTEESAAANLLIGPPPGVFDRIRNTIRKWQHKNEA
jgi:hemerythrin-like domain-containing protein